MAAVDVTVETLLAAFGSGVAVVTFAVLLTMAPSSTGAANCMTTDNVAVEPAGSSAAEQLIVPPAPTAGVLQANVGPPVCCTDTKVIPAGRVSVSVTLVALLGPAFVTVSTYVTGCPSVTTAGPLFATRTSALWVTAVVALELLFEAFTSKLLVATTAVLTIVTALPVLSVRHRQAS